MKIYSSYEYVTLLHQVVLFPELKEELDDRWVYNDKRYKKFLQKCLEHKLEPVSESEFFDRIEELGKGNKDLYKQPSDLRINLVIRIIVSNLRSQKGEAL